MTTESVTRYELRGRAGVDHARLAATRNALSAALVRELGDHLRAALADDRVRAIVLTGNGPAFCAGADLKNRGDAVAPGGAGRNPFVEILKLMWEGPKPVIVAANGHAFGGGLGLVAAADIALGAEGAAFSFSEVRVGVIPAMISVVVLPKLGVHHAMRLVPHRRAVRRRARPGLRAAAQGRRGRCARRRGRRGGRAARARRAERDRGGEAADSNGLPPPHGRRVPLCRGEDRDPVRVTGGRRRHGSFVGKRRPSWAE